jgi:ferredoxin-thioredoxin reductase catalytic subunit
LKPEPTPEEVGALYKRLGKDAAAGGYNINPDVPFAMALAEGLATNAARYGYALCPCRLTGGNREKDLDIICPCDYRDADLDEFDTCF